MAWIKRNLFFTIGGVVALLLMGAAGYYNYKSWNHNKEEWAALSDAYDQLQQDYNTTPSPGNDQVDNIKAAQDQEQQIRDWISQAKQQFTPVPPIPNPPDGNISTEEFAGSLRKTIQDLQQQATNLNVGLPPDYSFSFAAERNLVTFAPGSLDALASHLGEVKEICEILYASKINSLDGIQREVVSDNDATGPQSDYLPNKSVTTDVATVTPYVVTIHCFSSNLATVLSSLASSDHGFIVRGLNVMPAEAMQAPDQNGGGGGNGVMPMPGSGGLVTVLDEKQLQVTMEIDVVKLSKQ
jgi:hypothetical protein